MPYDIVKLTKEEMNAIRKTLPRSHSLSYHIHVEQRFRTLGK